MSHPDDPLFSQHEHALEQAYGVCPDCHGDLSIKRGKTGAFIGCNNFPHCQYTRPVVEQEGVDDQALPESECPMCGHELAVKQGRYGMFIGCTNFPSCHHIEHNNTPALNNQEQAVCPHCKKGKLTAKTTRYGKTFYPCDTYPKCKFSVNHEPINGLCEKCNFELLLKRQMASGEKLQCADKKCHHFQLAD